MIIKRFYPAKRHWRDHSLLQDIEDGLAYIAANYENWGIQSLAIPALGCGYGGLRWVEVQPLIEKYFSAIPDLDVYVYQPHAMGLKNISPDSRNPETSPQKKKIAAQPEQI